MADSRVEMTAVMNLRALLIQMADSRVEMTGSTNLRALLIQMADSRVEMKVELKVATKESMTQTALHLAG